MEQFNRIEIRGLIGNVRLANAQNKTGANFTIATNYAYKDKDGVPVIDTMWFSVVAWEGKNIQDLRRIVRGAIVQVSGRVRTYKYTTADGVEKSSWEVFARRVSVLEPDDDPVQPQRYL